MQLKRSGKHKHQSILQHISMVLAALFVFIIFAGLLHNHHRSVPKTDDREIVYAPEKCDVCDYCFHKSGKDFIQVPHVSFVVLKPTVSIFLTGFILGNYKFTLQGFTNKGPPALNT